MLSCQTRTISKSFGGTCSNLQMLFICLTSTRLEAWGCFLRGPQGPVFCVMFQASSVFGRFNLLLLLLQRVTIAQSFSGPSLKHCPLITRISHYFPFVIFVFSLWVHQNVSTTVTSDDLHIHLHFSLKNMIVFEALWGMLVLLIFRPGDLRWSSQTLWRSWRSVCRWQEKSPQGHASALSLSSVTWVSSACTRYVSLAQNSLKPNSHTSDTSTMHLIHLLYIR